MKRVLLTIILLSLTTSLFSQSITIGSDGIVRCKDVPIGTTQTILGDTYEVVDRNLLIQRRDEGADMGLMCVSNVTDMRDMFYRRTVNGNISNWDVSSVTNMSYMFIYSQFNQPLGNWDVSSVTNMEGIFRESPFNQPIGDWDVSSVTNMQRMFQITDFNQPIGNWDVSSVTNMAEMFRSSKFNQSISNWDVSSVTNMSYMFIYSQFNQPLGNWDVSSVTNMERMFNSSQFNQPIGSWDVSWVTNMSNMFRSSKFNQSISNWCTVNISSEPVGFSTSSPLSTSNKPIWGTCGGIPPSPQPEHILPGNNSENVSKTPLISWKADTVSTNYRLQIIEGFDPVVIDTLVTDTSFVPNVVLNGNTQYNWRVRGINENITFQGAPLTGEWSTIWSFTTDGEPVMAISLASPANNSTISGLTPTLIWNKNSAFQSYSVQVSTDGFSTTVVNQSVTDTTFTTPQLNYSTQYQWRVRGVNQDGTGDWSETWSFSTETFETFNMSISGPHQGWRMISSPVLGTTYGELLDGIWTQGYQGSNAASTTSNVYWYNESTRQWLSPASSSNIIGTSSDDAQNTSGRGIIVGVYADNKGNGVPDAWPKQLSVSGVAATGNIPIAVNRTEPFDGTQGWNLVGNPYPFSINWNDIVSSESLSNVEPVIFVYDSNVNNGLGGYRIHYGFSIPDTPSDLIHDGIIAPFQGFWARNAGNGTAGSINLTESHQASSDGTLYKETNTDTPFISVIVEGDNVADMAVIVLDEESQNGISRPASLSIPPLMFGTVENEELMAMSYVASPSNAYVSIPLGIKSIEDAELSMRWVTSDIVADKFELELIDTHTNESFNLSNTSSYQFTVEGSSASHKMSSDEVPLLFDYALLDSDKPRFVLRVSNNAVTSLLDTENEHPTEIVLYQNYPNPFNPSTTIRFSLHEITAVNLTVYDLLGRQVAVLINNEIRSIGEHQHSFDASMLSNGIYVYRLEANGTVISRRMTLLK
jgi:surface protein